MTMPVSADYQMVEDYRRVEQAIRYLERNAGRQPDLREVADSVHLSEYHFQRLFTRWAGISPKRFLQYLTKEHAKQMLRESGDLLETAYASGLSGPGRLHDLFVTYEAVTPGEYKRRGAGLVIHYGFHPSPFGECMLALSEQGVCGMAFVQDGDRAGAFSDLRERWSRAELVQDQERTRPYVAQLFSLFQGQPASPLRLHLRGTNFQLKVWEALLRIPPGQVVTYQDVAVSIGLPASARAVGGAIGRNPIPVIIPCHRVIRKVAAFGGYRWGSARKKALLAWEMARLEQNGEMPE